MMSLILKRPLVNILLVSSLVSSQTIASAGSCLTQNAKPANCVRIEFCPRLYKLAYSTVVSVDEEQLLRVRSCGERMVCCEKPSTPSPTMSSSEKPSMTKMSLPDIGVCGVSNLGNRVINGEQTGLNQYRWTVFLQYNITSRSDTLQVQCGGTLINTRYVITAAHCVKLVTPEKLVLRLGEWNLDIDPDCDEDNNCNDSVLYAKVEQIIIHEKYVHRYNDIALLKLSENTLSKDYTPYILPICLPTSETLRKNLFTNASVIVAGWGVTEKGRSSNIKMHANLNTIDLAMCNAALKWSKNLKLEQICAKSVPGIIRDTCNGDSGGPLMASVNGSWYLIGITSSGPPCGKTSLPLPGIYTRITSYMDWIQNNLLE